MQTQQDGTRLCVFTAYLQIPHVKNVDNTMERIANSQT